MYMYVYIYTYICTYTCTFIGRDAGLRGAECGALAAHDARAGRRLQLRAAARVSRPDITA